MPLSPYETGEKETKQRAEADPPPIGCLDEAASDERKMTDERIYVGTGFSATALPRRVRYMSMVYLRENVLGNLS